MSRPRFERPIGLAVAKNCKVGLSLAENAGRNLFEHEDDDEYEGDCD
jgi:hypothetical protein